jgi:predicted transcriptional regulator
VIEAHMLILPDAARPGGTPPPREVGVSCRICPRATCPARREPSILADGF